MNRLRFPQIDVLRAFAAITVVIFHVIAHFKWVSFPTTGPLLWFRGGGMGVDLFFVISGFVIALSAFSRLDRQDQRGFAVGFAWARLVRIVPLYYVTCLFFVLVSQPASIFDPPFRWQVLTHALFVHDFSVMHFGGIDGANWSVAVEMQFYALMLLTAPWLRRADWRVLLGGGIAVAWGWRLVAYWLVSTGGTLGVFPLFVATSQLPGMLDEFAVGVVLARFVRSGGGARVFDLLTRWVMVLPALTGGAWWAMLSLYWAYGTYWDHGPMVVCFKTLLAVCCGLAVLTACSLQARWFMFATAPLRYLGTISYGLYLWHLIVIEAIKRVTWVDGPTALPYVLGLTFVLAAGSWHFFEQPLMQRTRSASRPRNALPTAKE